MNSAAKDISVILVGLNACKFILECVDSLNKADWPDCSYEVIYVDNGSRDNTLEMLRQNHPEVKLLANPTNLGYCIAANQGARISSGRYYFFLNDDTIVLDDAIAMLMRFLQQTPQAGVVGSRLLNLDRTDQWSGRKFPSMLNAVFGRRSWLSRVFPGFKPLTDYLCQEQLQNDTPFVADWVSAAALMVSREIFNRVGGFAEDYYYWHEAVFCDRIRDSGKEIYLHPLSKIVHYEGKGSGARPYPVRKWHIIDFHRGAYRCYCEHYHLSRANPQRWFAAIALGARATLLLLGNKLGILKKA